MVSKEKIDFDKEIQKHLLDNRHVIIERHNNKIVSVEVFDTKDELLTLSKKYFHEDIDFLTAELAYVRECNSNYYDYLDEIGESFQDDDELITRDNYRKPIIGYDEYNKDIDKADFVDGFYEWNKLFGELKFPEPTKISYDCQLTNDGETDIDGVVTIEIF
jgi:hypothetical protein